MIPAAVLIADASPHGHALIDRERYLPQSWAGDTGRCRAAAIPGVAAWARCPTNVTPDLPKRPYQRSASERMLTIMKLYEIHAEARKTQLTAVGRATLPVAEIGPWLGRTYGAIADLLAARQAAPAGPPFARFHLLGSGRFEVEAGFPVSSPVEPSGDVQPSELPGSQVAVTVHVGPYDQTEPAYQALTSWVTDHGGELAGDPWEVYFSDPAIEPDPATWRTEIVQPYRQV